MESVSVRDIKADGNARIHVGNSSVTHVHNYAEGQERPGTCPTPFALIPFSRDPDFITRGGILSEIGAKCSKPAGRAALVGLGGVGKSQLAIEFAHQKFAEKGSIWVFWVHAGTKARVEEGFRAIADAVNLAGRHSPKSNIPQLLHTWLSNENNGQWLMILDSADDRDVFYDAEASGNGQPPLASYLPQSRNGSILITTRDQSLAFRLTGHYQHIIKVGPMEPDEALSFLKKKLGPLDEPEASVELVKALDCIPLAINQAASYIQARAPRSTVKKYLIEFQESEKKSAKLLALDAAELRRDGSASNAIMKTWQISFDHIRSKKPSAADLLSLMSFFDNQSIPESALNPEDEYDSDCDSDLESNWGSEDLANQASMLRLSAAKERRNAQKNDSDSDDESTMESGFEEDIATLRDYCLISVSETGTDFEMHRLVQLATRKWLAASKKQEEFKQLFISRLSAATPWAHESSEPQYRNLFAHFQIATGYRPNKTNTRFWLNICYHTAWYLEYLKQYQEAKAVLEKGLAAWKARKGPEHSEYLVCESFLVTIILGLGQECEAEALAVKILDLQKKTLPPDSKHTLYTMRMLANIYVKQKRYRDAEKLQLYVIEKQTAEFGPEAQITLASMSCLAETYYWEGRLEESEKLELQILDISKRVLGPDHYDTLRSMADLALTYSEQDRYVEAAELELQALHLWPTSQKAETASAVGMKIHLAEMYSEQSLHEKSLALNSELVTTLTAKLGPDHPETLDSMANVAENLKALGDHEEAKHLLLTVLEKCTTQSDPEFLRSSRCARTLSSIYRLAFQYKEAEELLSDLLARERAAVGDEHIRTLNTMVDLASVYRWQSRVDESARLCRQVLTTLKQTYSISHLSTLRIWSKLVYSEFEDPKDHAVLADLLEAVLNSNMDEHGPESSQAIESIWHLAMAKDSLGELEETATLFTRGLEFCKAKHGSSHLETVKFMEHLAHTQRDLEEYESAKELYVEVLEIRRATLGHGHRATLRTMESLAWILYTQRQLAEAEDMQREVAQGYEKMFGRHNWTTVYAFESLARTVAIRAEEEKDCREEAARLLNECMEISMLVKGENSAEVYILMREAAWAFAGMERVTEAVPLAEASYVGLQRLRGPDDPYRMLSMRVLAQLWEANDEYVKSTALQRECVGLFRRVLGPDHPDTVAVEELYDRWVQELKDHVANADVTAHPFDTCPACLANKDVLSLMDRERSSAV